MTVRLHITMDEDLYRRLNKHLMSRGISAFIDKAVRARIHPDRRTLDAAYKAASNERWRRRLVQEWSGTETEGWPE